MLRFFGRRLLGNKRPDFIHLRSRHGHRPALELLEDRTLPASFGYAFGWGQPGENAMAVDKAGDMYVPTASALWKFSPSDPTGTPLWTANWGGLYLPGPSGSGPGGLGVGGGLGEAVAVDAAGNVYVASDAGSVEKFNGTSGQLLWVRWFGTSDPEDPYASISSSLTGLALDPAGNVYVTGSFTTGDTPTHHVTLTFWSGAAFQAPATAFTSGTPPASGQPLNLYQPYAWGPGAFVAELDGNGQLLWDGGLLNTGPGPSFRNIYTNADGIAADAAGNVYIAGGFAGTTNFDPNGGSYVLTSSTNNPYPSSYAFPPDAFVLKLSSAHQLVWVDDIRGTSSNGSVGNSEARGIATDAAGDVYLTGGFGGNVYFDPASGSYEHAEENSYAFVDKLDTNGVFQWFTEVYGASSVGRAIALDPAGNVYSTGNFKPSGVLPTYFGSTLPPFESQWNQNAYVWQLDANGNTTWVGQLGGPNTFVDGYAIGVDSAGDIFAAGQMIADPNNVPEFTAVPVYFDPGPGGPVLQTNSFGQSFLIKLTQPPPTVQSVVIDDGANDGNTIQRSMVDRLTITFSTVVALSQGAIEVDKNGGGAEGLVVNTSVVGMQTVAVVTFTGADIIGGSLADGRYNLVIHSGLVTDTLGHTLDGTGSGQSGNDFTDQFFRLFGDALGAGTVTNQDASLFRRAYLNHEYLAFFDYFGTGTLTIADFGQLQSRLGKRV